MSTWSRNDAAAADATRTPASGNAVHGRGGSSGTRGKPIHVVSPPSGAGVSGRSIRVLMLGFSGSGKTVFLTSMWQQMKAARTGVMFETDDHTRRRLNSYYERMKLNEDFPAATGETFDITFTVNAKAGERLIKLFNLTYVDYDGDLLDLYYHYDDSGAGQEEGLLDSRIADADVLLGVLDGERIYKIVHGTSDPYYEVWLHRLFDLLFQQKNKTIHLVLTKFDLFVRDTSVARNELSRIVTALSNFSSFTQFTEFPWPGKLRLIPVAALGKKRFVQVQDGKNKIHKENDLDPSDTEFPLACTLPDVLHTDLARLRAASPENRRRLGATPPDWRHYRVLQWVTATLAAVEVVAIPVATGGHIELAVPLSKTLMDLSHLLGDSSLRPSSFLPRRKNRERFSASDESRALEYIIEQWTAKTAELERDYPASVLNPKRAGTPQSLTGLSSQLPDLGGR